MNNTNSVMHYVTQHYVNFLQINMRTLYNTYNYIYRGKMFDVIVVFALIFALGLFNLGLIAPDFDHKLGLKHRGISHSIWIVILFFIISWKINLVYYFAFGYLIHLLFDSVSASGVCFLYPFSSYIEYSGGARVKKGHRVKLYKVKSYKNRKNRSEDIFVIIWIVIFLIMLFLN